jgi:hypothetical protein
MIGSVAGTDVRYSTWETDLKGPEHSTPPGSLYTVVS